MYVGTAAAALEHPGNEDFVVPQGSAADRAAPEAVPLQAIYAAPDVHETVFAAGKGRKRLGFYQIPFIQPGGTDRTNLGVPGGGGFLTEPSPF
jgi:hypothetical protein